jgi:hypothetical protein
MHSSEIVLFGSQMFLYTMPSVILFLLLVTTVYAGRDTSDEVTRQETAAREATITAITNTLNARLHDTTTLTPRQVCGSVVVCVVRHTHHSALFFLLLQMNNAWLPTAVPDHNLMDRREGAPGGKKKLTHDNTIYNYTHTHHSSWPNPHV